MAMYYAYIKSREIVKIYLILGNASCTECEREIWKFLEDIWLHFIKFKLPSIHSFCSLSYDRSIASSKASSQQRAS
jgi:hypothetical protein